MTPTDYIKELVTENWQLREEIQRLKAELEAQKEAAPDSSEDGK